MLLRTLGEKMKWEYKIFYFKVVQLNLIKVRETSKSCLLKHRFASIPVYLKQCKHPIPNNILKSKPTGRKLTNSESRIQTPRDRI